MDTDSNEDRRERAARCGSAGEAERGGVAQGGLKRQQSWDMVEGPVHSEYQSKQIVVDFDGDRARGHVRHDAEQEELDAADRILEEARARASPGGRTQEYVEQKRRQLEAGQTSSKLQ